MVDHSITVHLLHKTDTPNRDSEIIKKKVENEEESTEQSKKIDGTVS